MSAAVETKTTQPGTAPEAQPGPRGERVIGLRAIVLGLVCSGALSAVSVYSDLVMRGTSIAYNALPIGVLTAFCVLVGLVNTLLRRVHRRLAFTYHELLAAYMMMLMAASLPSLGLTIPILNIIPAADYFASKENGWAEAFFRFIPDWIRMQDPKAAKAFYESLPAGQPIPWGAWLIPLAAWSAFAFLWFFAYFCLAVLVRRQWVERERLAFPLAELPLEIARGDERPTISSPFFRDGAMWIGFAIPWLLHNTNGLWRYFPAMPNLRLTGIPIGQALQSLPWSALQNTQLTVYFSVIGLTFLISSQVSSSSLVFYALARAEAVAFAMTGFTRTGNSDPTYFTLKIGRAHV